MMTPLQPSMIAVNDECASTSGVAPISRSSGRANQKPSEADRDRDEDAERDRLHRGARAPSGSRSPMRRATIAVAPTLRPIATA